MSLNLIQTIYLVLIFVAVFLAALFVMTQLGPQPVRKRLLELGKENEALDTREESSPWVARIVKISGPLARLSLPDKGWENSKLRMYFMNAGYRGSSAPILYFGAKTLFALLLPAIVLLYGTVAQKALSINSMLVLVLLAAAIGYFLPNAVLAKRISDRKRDIFESFPDALDLTTVCVEAGLGLDAALARVAQEMRFKSPVLGEELHMVTLELRAGSSRERALRNLALRTGLEEIDTLVAMLVQSDRFGTSVADSLRVHSENLRTKRRLRAEEAAAKIPLKLLFPLIFFIFPSLLVVLLGPAGVHIYRIFLPTITGSGG